MSTSLLHVERAGPLVTIQDGGRQRLMRYGIPASGPMDRFGHAAANTVLGCPVASSAVEVSLGGLSVVCAAGEVTIAVCGGGFSVLHNGAHVGPWTVCTLRTADRLAISAGPWGSWCYLAFAGELSATEWLGSTSTHVRSGLGGGTLSQGADLIINDAQVDDARDGEVAVPRLALAGREVRVVAGPQLEYFHPEALQTLTESEYRYTAAYDRMGVRLDGATVGLNDALAIASSPIVRGSIQVAGDGVATLLFADHQTTGGYPKIATAISCDVSPSTQLRTGDLVRFVAVEPHQAISAARLYTAQAAAALSSLQQRPGMRTRALLDTNLIDGVFYPDDYY